MAPKEVPKYPLGKFGPKVPALGFGLMGMSYQVYGSVASDEDRFAVLDRALEIGSTFWDSSDLYGDSETLLGKWFKRTQKRDQIFLATKFGYIKGGGVVPSGMDSSAAYCKKACEASLKALGTDYIDLYYMHVADLVTPIEETMRALVDLKKEGKIKYIGLSMVSSNTVRRAEKVAHVDAVQIDYSVFTRDVESSAGTNLLATCRELGIAVVAACPLSRGMVTSAFSKGEAIRDKDTDVRAKFMPRFHEDNQAHNARLITQFQALADKKGCTVSQLALAWLLKQGHDVFPIPGTKRIKYLEENWAALDVQLSDEEEAEVRAFVEKSEAAGGPVPPQAAGQLFKDTKEEESTSA